MEKKPCIRCLLRELDKDEYMKSIHEYIERIEDDIKANDDLYEERLLVCKSCDYLLDGMCRACGCFVELRAKIEANVCPYEKW